MSSKELDYSQEGPTENFHFSSEERAKFIKQASFTSFDYQRPETSVYEKDLEHSDRGKGKLGILIAFISVLALVYFTINLNTMRIAETDKKSLSKPGDSIMSKIYYFEWNMHDLIYDDPATNNIIVVWGIMTFFMMLIFAVMEIMVDWKQMSREILEFERFIFTLLIINVKLFCGVYIGGQVYSIWKYNERERPDDLVTMNWIHTIKAMVIIIALTVVKTYGATKYKYEKF